MNTEQSGLSMYDQYMMHTNREVLSELSNDKLNKSRFLKGWMFSEAEYIVFQLADNNYDHMVIRLMWAYYRLNNQHSLEKYSNTDGPKKIIDDYGGNIDDFISQNSGYYDLCLPLFRALIDTNENVGVLRFIPNIINETLFFIIKIKDQFLLTACEISQDVHYDLNNSLLKEKLFGTFVLISFITGSMIE